MAWWGQVDKAEHTDPDDYLLEQSNVAIEGIPKLSVPALWNQVPSEYQDESKG